jgi:hypothetical protein
MGIRDVWPQCQSAHYKKNGHIHNGKQNHQCQDCGRQFVRCFEQYVIPEETRALIARLLVERISYPCAVSVALWVSTSSGAWAFWCNALPPCRTICTSSSCEEFAHHVGAIKLFTCPYNLTKVKA